MSSYARNKPHMLGANIQAFMFTPGTGGGSVASNSFGWPFGFRYDIHQFSGGGAGIALSNQQLGIGNAHPAENCASMPKTLVIDCIFPEGYGPLKYVEACMSGRHFLQRQTSGTYTIHADARFDDSLGHISPVVVYHEIYQIPQYRWIWRENGNTGNQFVTPYAELYTPQNRPVLNSDYISNYGWGHNGDLNYIFLDSIPSPGSIFGTVSPNSWLYRFGPRMKFTLSFGGGAVHTYNGFSQGPLQDSVFGFSDNTGPQWTVVSTMLTNDVDPNPEKYFYFSDFRYFGYYVWRSTASDFPYILIPGEEGIFGDGDGMFITPYSRYNPIGTNIYGCNSTTNGGHVHLGWMSEYYWPDESILGIPYGASSHPLAQTLTVKAIH